MIPSDFGSSWGRRLLLLSAVLGAAYLTDRAVYASGLARTLRTLGTGLVVALDYKLNFRPDPLPWLGGAAGIPELHRRNAERLFALLHHNGGLYLKIGQAIAMQSAVLPPEFARMFARMFDDAPQDGWDKIERVIREDFDGRSVQEVFGVRFADSEGKADAEGTGVMETTARASASVAQVHYGKLPDGREIAVKIQKPDIAKQINWDLWAFKVVTRVYTWWFDLPLYGFVPFITERLRLETDFENEAKNSETMRDLINGNIFIRRLETGKPELVLIDHGLYVYMSEEFRREYSRFWKAMMTYDNKTLKEISTGWGINSVDLFASATLMRPYEGDKGELKNKILAATDGKTASERSYEMQRRMKQGIRSMLADETKWPQELIFIGRNMRIVQANNQSMGSPVNRIKMMGNWASRSMYEDRSLPLRERLRNAYRHLLFRGVLVLSDVAFYFFKLRAWLGIGRNMEDEVEARMKDVAKDFGVELQHDVFEG
ncbi:hypothetical protein P8C59_009303 [Phyllachora maydis]|uniref:ABC1 atypical kinase-like domain-containing protein n=1 Tax=Phyllachora maydis TaxID=1825666 RepID=A0AAD9ICC4_9PEZI|nr:hypothetical protein P8C59_009303 [Phyllachora maydis]